MAQKKGKNPAAMAMVRMRLLKISPERRKEIATRAAKARWASKATQAAQPSN